MKAKREYRKLGRGHRREWLKRYFLKRTCRRRVKPGYDGSWWFVVSVFLLGILSFFFGW